MPHLSPTGGIYLSPTGGILPYRNSSKHRFPSTSTEELVLPRHARCVLSRLRCNGYSLLLSSYLSRISRIENPSSGACGHSSQDTSHLILHCSATDCLATLGLFMTFGSGAGELPGFWGSMVFRHALIPRKGRVTTTNIRERTERT